MGKGRLRRPWHREDMACYCVAERKLRNVQISPGRELAGAQSHKPCSGPEGSSPTPGSRLRSWGLHCPLPCCWDTFVSVNNGPRALVLRASGNTGADMENLRREAAQPFVPSGTLELNFPALLYRWVPAFGTSLHPSTNLPTPPQSAVELAGILVCRGLGVRHVHTHTKEGKPPS